MLYERWRGVVARESGAIALYDVPTGRSWTFKALAEEAERTTCPPDEVVFPCGISAEFVLSVLTAWRHNRTVCPLEMDQKPPSFVDLPKPGTAHLKTTSATSGHPRLVIFQAEQLAADAENIVRTMGLRPDWPNLGAISLAHSYGFSNLVLPLLLHGIPLWITGGPLPELLRRAAGDLPSATLPAVPALWKMWHQAHAIPSNVRLAISAGAPLPLALENHIYGDRGLKIHNFYGSSECGGIAYDSTSVPRTCGAVAGTPLHHVRVGISDNGCLEVHGPAVACSYWPHPDPVLHAGTFRTGDLGEIKEGTIYLLGRATDQINVAGRKVDPELIERALTTHPDVKDCLVFGVPAGDHHRGEKIVACLCLTAAGTLEAVKDHVLTHLPAWQVPREWRVMDSLHVNGRGKRSRAEWKKNYTELLA